MAFYKKYRQLFQFGRFYRLENPDTVSDNVYGWEVVNDDRTAAIAARFQILNGANPAYIRVYFAGLDPEKQYTVNGGDEKFSGAELMLATSFPGSWTGPSRKRIRRTLAPGSLWSKRPSQSQ